MSYQWHDFVGNLGVVFILACFLLVEMERMVVLSLRYYVLNALGALLILVSLVVEFNLSAMLMETAWLVISLMGCRKVLLRRQSG